MFGLLPKFHINHKFDSGVMTSFILLGNLQTKNRKKIFVLTLTNMCGLERAVTPNLVCVTYVPLCPPKNIMNTKLWL